MAYSQVELYKKAQELLGGKGVVKRVAPTSPRRTGFPTDTSMYANIIDKSVKAWSDKQDKDAAKATRVADQAAARSMFEDYMEPQPAWKAEEYGSTPKTLRDAGFKVSMSDALGDQSLEGDEPADQNWMTADESKQFYNAEATKAQADFDAENPYGINALKDSYATANKPSMIDQLMGNQPPAAVEGEITGAMRMALMGDSARKRESDEARLLTEQDARVKYTRGLEAEGRGQEYKMALAAYKRKNGVGAKYSNSPIWGTDENGKSVLMQTNNAGGELRIAKLPPGVTAQRGQISFRDLGDKLAIFDADGTFIGFRPKGLPPERVVTKAGVVTLPPVPGKETSNGNNQTSSATGIPGVIAIEPLPVTNKQLASQINSQIRPMVEARKTGQLALDLIDANKDGVIPMSGTFSQIASWNSDSNQGILLSYIENLKSPNVLGAMMALKEASSTGATGFGQLNIKELDILINRLGALNAKDTHVEVLRRSIVSVNDSFDSVINMVKKNVSEEKLKELELHKLFYPPNSSRVKTETNASPVSDAAKESDVTQEMWNNMSPEDRKLFQ